MDLEYNAVSTNRRSQAISLLPDVAAIIILSALLLIIKLLPPFIRPFSTSDMSISHPHVPDIVPTYVAVLVFIALPVVICLAVTRSYISMLAYVRSFGIGALVVDVTTDWIKKTAGRLRPDFLDRCKPLNGTCTGDALLISEGRVSFPSGHSSVSFYGSVFLALWVWYIGCQSLKWRSNKRLVMVVGALLPLLGATYVSISRTQQYVHFPTDVLTGALIGSVGAVLAFLDFWISWKPLERNSIESQNLESAE